MYLLETAHSSFCSRRIAPTSRVIAFSLGKMPTTLVRRLISPLRRSSGFGRMQLLAVLPGEAHVGEDVVLGLVHEGGELWRLGPELVGDQAPLCGGTVGIVLGKRGCDEGGDDAPALPAGMGQQVAHEADAAPLSSCAEDPGRGGLHPVGASQSKLIQTYSKLG